MASSKDQERYTVRQTPDSIDLPSPAELIVRSSYRRGSHSLDCLSSRESAVRSSSSLLSDRPAVPSKRTSSCLRSSSQQRSRSHRTPKSYPPLSKNPVTSKTAHNVTLSSATRSRPYASHLDGNIFYLIREQFRAGSVGGRSSRPGTDSVISQPSNPNSQSTSCYSTYEETIHTTKEWRGLGSTAEEPQSLIAPPNRPLSGSISTGYSKRYLESSQSLAAARVDLTLVPTIEMQCSGTDPLQEGNSTARRSNPTRVPSRQPIQLSSISRRPLNNTENRMSLMRSWRPQTVLSHREKTPSGLGLRNRSIHTPYALPDPSPGPQTGLEQEWLGTDPPLLNSDDSLFSNNAGLLSQADVAESRFITPIATERQTHYSVQSIHSDATTSQAESLVSGIDDAYLEELAKGGRLDHKRGQGTTAARRKREEDARKRARSPGYWRQRQKEEEVEIAAMAREERQSKLSEPRAKLPWSSKETERLVRLWEKHPNEWARIERLDRASDDPQLATRTQVDLKDKMRNVKMWMLKNGVQLSGKWARITLTTAQKRAVAKAYRDGIIPRERGDIQRP